jgi:hypothetical protein
MHPLSIRDHMISQFKNLDGFTRLDRDDSNSIPSWIQSISKTPDESWLGFYVDTLKTDPQIRILISDRRFVFLENQKILIDTQYVNIESVALPEEKADWNRVTLKTLDGESRDIPIPICQNETSPAANFEVFLRRSSQSARGR